MALSNVIDCTNLFATRMTNSRAVKRAEEISSLLYEYKNTLFASDAIRVCGSAIEDIPCLPSNMVSNVMSRLGECNIEVTSFANYDEIEDEYVSAAGTVDFVMRADNIVPVEGDPEEYAAAVIHVIQVECNTDEATYLNLFPWCPDARVLIASDEESVDISITLNGVPKSEEQSGRVAFAALFGLFCHELEFNDYSIVPFELDTLSTDPGLHSLVIGRNENKIIAILLNVSEMLRIEHLLWERINEERERRKAEEE